MSSAHLAGCQVHSIMESVQGQCSAVGTSWVTCRVGGHHRAEAVKYILDAKCLRSCTFHNTAVDQVTLDNVGCFTHSKLEIKPVPFLPSLIYLMNSFIFE